MTSPDQTTPASPGNDGSMAAGTALGHLRVLDLSRILAGPWATQCLADLGAEVIKVESPAGDDTRRWGPPFMPNTSGNTEDAAYFSACNRNKKSITVNFASAQGAELIKKLAAKSDVFIENFKVGGLKRYGLDYASLKAINPGIIYCSITGFGQYGPYAHRAGYDFLIQGMGGLMSVTGQPDGAPGAEPVKVGVAVTDLFTGMYAATSILAALHHRDRTGHGQQIDCALLDTQVAMLANQAANWINGGVNPGRMGNNHPNIVPYGAYAASDGHVIITCGNDDQFQRLCRALSLPEMASNPAYASNSKRVQNRDSLDQQLGARLGELTRAELISMLEQVKVPCGAINSVEDVFADAQVQSRGLQINSQRGDGTDISTVAFPARLSATPASYRHAPPALGQDTENVLTEVLGLDTQTLVQLKTDTII